MISIAAHISAKYMRSNGLLVFTGAAKVFKDSCPGKKRITLDMLAYQIAMTSTHSLALALKDSSDLPEGTCIVTILPYDVHNLGKLLTLLKDERACLLRTSRSGRSRKALRSYSECGRMDSTDQSPGPLLF